MKFRATTNDRQGVEAHNWRLTSRVWGLRSRIALVLAFTILPVGLVGVWQARAILIEERLRNADVLVGEARERVNASRSVISAAFAALDAIDVSNTVPGDRCGEIVSRFVEGSADAVFLGFVDVAGILRCRSDRESPVDVSTQAGFQDLLANPRPTVALLEPGVGTGEAVIVVARPLRRDDKLLGFLSISIARDRLEGTVRDADEGRETRLALFRTAGSALLGAEDVSWFPRDLEGLLRDAARTADGDVASLVALGRDGATRQYVVAPVVEEELFELSAWASPRAFEAPLAMLAAVAFPVLMWLAAVAVAFASLERLVVRPVRAIRRDMQAFGAQNRRLPREPDSGAASEIAEVHGTLGKLAERIVGEERRMRDMLVQQRLLLKEVHHRVQNNLQIITTMIRMHVRELEDETARAAVRQLEDRTMTMAAAHSASYEAGKLDAIPAAPLIERVLEAVAGPDWRLRLTLEVQHDLHFDADTGLSVSMIVGELLISASAQDSGSEIGALSIMRDAADRKTAVLTLRYRTPSDAVPPSSFGERMIQAFVHQLGAQRSEQHDDDNKTVTVRFRLQEDSLD